MIRVYYTQAQVENISPGELENWSRAAVEELPSVKREQILRLRPPLSRFISALGWQLVKFAFRRSAYPDFELSQLRFEEQKKPRWPGKADFNLSHSGSLLACALTDNGLVGIDVEQVRMFKDDARMFEHILSPQETLPPEPGRHELFFQYWTRKEAVIKAEGSSGVWNMAEARLQESHAYYKNTAWHLYPLELVAGYASCIACDRDQEFRVEAVALEHLMNDEG